MALRLSGILVHIGEQINRQGIAELMTFEEILDVLRTHFREMLDKEKKRSGREGRLTFDQLDDYRSKLNDTNS